MKLKLETNPEGKLKYYLLGNILIAFPHKHECEEYADVFFTNCKIDGRPRILECTCNSGIPQYINWDATRENNYEAIFYTDEEIDEALGELNGN